MPKRKVKHRLPTDKELAKGKTCEHLPLVRVYWGDANNIRFWRSFEEAREKASLSSITSVGHLLKRTEELVLLFSTYTKGRWETRVNGCETIPTANITKIEVIEPARNQPK